MRENQLNYGQCKKTDVVWLAHFAPMTNTERHTIVHNGILTWRATADVDYALHAAARNNLRLG
jgi:hypothetical protein